MKASRNKTIDISVEEGVCYLNRCISVTEPSSVEEILDKTINGDSFDILPKLPKQFVDLLIVDPPYNLDKDFNGQKFKKKTDDLYEQICEYASDFFYEKTGFCHKGFEIDIQIKASKIQWDTSEG